MYSAGTTYQKSISEERNVERVYVGELVPARPEYTDGKGERAKEHEDTGPRLQEGRKAAG